MYRNRFQTPQAWTFPARIPWPPRVLWVAFDVGFCDVGNCLIWGNA